MSFRNYPWHVSLRFVTSVYSHEYNSIVSGLILRFSFFREGMWWRLYPLPEHRPSVRPSQIANLAQNFVTFFVVTLTTCNNGERERGGRGVCVGGLHISFKYIIILRTIQNYECAIIKCSAYKLSGNFSIKFQQLYEGNIECACVHDTDVITLPNDLFLWRFWRPYLVVLKTDVASIKLIRVWCDSRQLTQMKEIWNLQTSPFSVRNITSFRK